MDIIEFRDFCLSLPGTDESTPFAAFPGGDDILVFKVGGKMFTLASMDNFDSFYVKCKPEDVIELREKYAEITHARNMSRKHWVDVGVDAGIDDGFMKKLILESYRLVITGLPKAKQAELAELSAEMNNTGKIPEQQL